MKKNLLLTVLIFALISNASAQSTILNFPSSDYTSNFKVTNNSNATLLKLNGDAGFYIGGTYEIGTIPTTGAGTRLMWYPKQAAFRAGKVDGTQWDNSNIGYVSTAMGSCTIASGNSSTAMGSSTIASGNYSTAMGSGTIASGAFSTALGSSTKPSGNTSTAMGYATVASGDYSTAIGSKSEASGDYSFAAGISAHASGKYATAIGPNTSASAYGAFVIGRYNIASGTATSWVATEQLFVVGNGVDATAHSNALTLYKNGNMTIAGNFGIGVTEPLYPIHIAKTTSTEDANNVYFNSSSSTSLSLDGSGPWDISIYGTSYIAAATGFIAFSDRRIKKDIKNIENSLSTLSRLRPVTYKMKDDVTDKNTHYGFIAQEVEAVIPDAVNTGKGEVPVLKTFDNVTFEEDVEYTILVKNGKDVKEQTYKMGDARPDGDIIVKSQKVDDFKSISYDMIFTVAVDAIQEQEAKIEAQQKQIDMLTQTGKEFKIQNDELEKQLSEATAENKEMKLEIAGLQKNFEAMQKQITALTRDSATNLGSK